MNYIKDHIEKIIILIKQWKTLIWRVFGITALSSEVQEVNSSNVPTHSKGAKFGTINDKTEVRVII